MVLQNRANLNQGFGALNDAADGGFQALVFPHKLHKNTALLLSVRKVATLITNTNSNAVSIQ